MKLNCEPSNDFQTRFSATLPSDDGTGIVDGVRSTWTGIARPSRQSFSINTGYITCHFLQAEYTSFQAVLYYYQSGGRLRRPIEVPDDVFLEELHFYEISDAAIVDYKVKEGFIMEKVSTGCGNALCNAESRQTLAHTFGRQSVRHLRPI